MKVVEFYTLWIAALESDDYSQTKNSLRRPAGFCCLGVAADLLIKHSLIKASWDNFDCVHGLCQGLSYEQERWDISLPEVIEKTLQLTKKNSAGRPYTQVLPNMNDAGDKTFPEIAAYIRQEILPKIDPDLKLELS